MSLLSRGVKSDLAQAFFEATVQTYLDSDTLPKNFKKACEVPKASGGLGLWAPRDGYYCNSQSDIPDVVTDFKLNREGAMTEFGSAHMTDAILGRIARERNLNVEVFSKVREEMIGDSFISTLGPKAKYGSRRFDKTANMLKLIRQTKYKSHRYDFTPGVADVSKALARKLLDIAKDPENMAQVKFITPACVIANTITRSGCLNSKIYCIVNNVQSKSAMIENMISTQKPADEQAVVDSLDSMKTSEKHVFYNDELRVAFNDVEDKINVEVLAYIRRAVLNTAALNHHALGLRGTKQTPADKVKWEIICVKMARMVWERVGDRYSEVAF
jgi:hypothetical protein